MSEPAFVEFKVAVYRPKSYRDDPAFESSLEMPLDMPEEQRTEWTGRWLKMMEAAVSVAGAIEGEKRE